MQKTEIRTVATALRSASEFKLEGTACTYGMLSKDLGGFRERIAAGAFTRSLASSQDVVCTFNHSSDRILGRLRNGTLTLSDSPRSLDFSCQLDRKQQAHQDLYSSVARGDISECSFAFAIDGPDGEAWDDDAQDERGQRCARRTVRTAKLFDVSAVTSPAYGNGATQVNARQFRSCDYAAPLQTQQFVRHILQTPASTDAENRKRLLVLGTAICRDKASNDIITDFELRQRLERLGRVIERDDNAEALAQLAAELGVE